jgi:predicted enzyme related to lactoylglutathione lyase
MSERREYLEGVPCWVDTLQRDPRAALDFYGQLFGWEFGEPGAMPGGLEYFVARLRGRDVAGVGALPAEAPPYWNTHIRVEDAEAAAQRAAAADGGVLIGALDALPAGRLVVLRDPTGVPFVIWEARERAGAQLVNEPGAWTMSSLHTPDPIGAAEFYGAVFGWRTAPLGDELTLCRLPGYAGERGQPIPADTVALIAPIADAVPAHWNVNFRVDDADVTGEHAARLGGSLLGPPVDALGLRSAVIADPQGAVFSVSAVRPD